MRMVHEGHGYGRPDTRRGEAGRLLSFRSFEVRPNRAMPAKYLRILLSASFGSAVAYVVPQ
jgi:hypothetical protein